MVGIVIVSHSLKLAEGVVDATRIMADGCSIACAGGDDDGGYGTSYNKIKSAVLSVAKEDGAVILMDMGSAVMTTEMVVEEIGRSDIIMVDCPIAEGAISASLTAISGGSLNEVAEEAKNVSGVPKW